LHKFLSDKTDHTYNLRSRRHSLSLTVITDCSNFLNRLILQTFISCLFIIMVAFCQLPYVSKENDDDDDDDDEVCSVTRLH